LKDEPQGTPGSSCCAFHLQVAEVLLKTFVMEEPHCQSTPPCSLSGSRVTAQRIRNILKAMNIDHGIITISPLPPKFYPKIQKLISIS
jgi:hypothetical protein